MDNEIDVSFVKIMIDDDQKEPQSRIEERIFLKRFHIIPFDQFFKGAQKVSEMSRVSQSVVESSRRIIRVKRVESINPFINNCLPPGKKLSAKDNAVSKNNEWERGIEKEVEVQ